MRGFSLTLAALVLSALSASAGVGWRGLDAAHYLAGRKASEGYLQGKVVMVCKWDATNAVTASGTEILPRMEDVWDGFKSKQFVLLGSPLCDASATNEVRTSLAEAKVTFPVYFDAGITNREPRIAGGLTVYVVDETGLVVYRGKDERLATQAVVMSLTDLDAPKNAKQWRKFIDYELENLPAHAYNRLNAFKKKYPKDAKDYAAALRKLAALPQIKEVADLVAFAKRAKDAPAFGPKDRAKKKKYQSLVGSVLEKCEPLKGASDPRLAQEAKNSIADLKWIQATF